MGKNDHQPVPDPVPNFLHKLPGGKTRQPLSTPETPRVHIPPKTLRDLSEANAQLESLEADGYTSANNFIQVTERLNQLERGRERHDAQAVTMFDSITRVSLAIVRLQRLLRQTVRGVERLSQGHSKGNLGLPTDEDWKSYDTTL